MIRPALESAVAGSAMRSAFGLDEPDESWFQRAAAAEAPCALGNVGAYELLEEIGRGGQGTVYKARRSGTQGRMLALKRLAAGTFATAEMKGRLQRELEVSAALDHPGIVRVHSIETIDGQPVLSMDWIDGVAIDAWADKRTLREILEVFARVCDAVGYAHQHGMLHRDLKPSNILVDANAQPHVLDFGLAKASIPGVVACQVLTQGSGFLGTPAFASPEQIAGRPQDVDVRCDVYALGAVLYCMLTGAPPFQPRESLASLFDAIRSDDPVRASARRPDLNGEIDAIVLKALEKAPDRRYQSVGALGEDVRRYLANEAVLAHPPSAIYVARKFIARHKGPVFGAAVALAALVLGLVGVSLALIQTRAAKQQSESAQRDAQQVSGFLNEMLAADPNVTRGHNLSVSAMLDEAVQRLDRGALAQQRQAQADVRGTISDAYASLGLYPQARTQLETALNLHRELHGDSDADVIRTMIRLANLLSRAGLFVESEAMCDRAIALAERLSPRDEPLLLDALMARAQCLSRQGLEREALRQCLNLLPTAKRLAAGSDSRQVADIEFEIGFLGFEDPPKGAREIEMFDDALGIYRRLYGEEDDRVALVLVNRGAKFVHLSEWERAEADLTRGLEMRMRLFGEDHPSTASALYNLGWYHQQREHWEQAEQLLRQSLAICERHLLPGHHEIIRAHRRLGEVLCSTGRLTEAEAELRIAREAWRDQLPGRLPYMMYASDDLEFCLRRQGRFSEAEAVLLEMIALCRQHAPSDAAAVRKIGLQLVNLYGEWGKNDQADLWRKRVTDQPAEGGAANVAPAEAVTRPEE